MDQKVRSNRGDAAEWVRHERFLLPAKSKNLTLASNDNAERSNHYGRSLEMEKAASRKPRSGGIASKAKARSNDRDMLTEAR